MSKLNVPNQCRIAGHVAEFGVGDRQFMKPSETGAHIPFISNKNHEILVVIGDLILIAVGLLPWL